MKNLLVCVLIFMSLSSCQDTKSEETYETTTEIKDGIATSTFKVWGNCGMCEKTIEGSLKVDGVKSSDWNRDTKIIKVTYDPKVITLDQIQKNIAAVGYDNDKYKADDETYNNLHGCCKYERK